MNKSVLALSTALSILAFSPAFAQETAPAPAAQVDCTVAANANDPACMNKQDNATTGQSDTTTTQPSTTTGQSDSTTTTTTTGQSGTDATTDTTGSTAPLDNSTTSMSKTSTGGSLIIPAEQLNSAQLITSSDFVGKAVYDQNGENIGEVNDMVLSATGDIRAVILGVGGFLGIGEKSVAVSVDAIKMTQDGDTQRLVIEATKEMLESAPSYDISSRRYTDSSGTTTAPATDMNATGTGTTGTGTTTTTEQPAAQQ